MIKAKNSQHNAFVQALNDLALDMGEDLDVRSYSGRGMYGKNCAGVTISNGWSEFDLALAIAAQLASEDHSIDTISFLIGKTKSDDMGLDTIIYWPSVEVND